MMSVPVAQITSTAGKINAFEFQGAAAESLLFEGATTEAQYDYERSQTYGYAFYFHRIHYRFLWRPISHNVVWRAPRQRRDGLGSPKYTPDGRAVLDPGLAGVGGWDRPVPPLYESADFAPLLSGTGSPRTVPAEGRLGGMHE